MYSSEFLVTMNYRALIIPNIAWVIQQLQANLTSEEGSKILAAEIAKRESKVDVLINNSGVAWGGDINNHPGHGET